jgi:hypothetical protein
MALVTLRGLSCALLTIAAAASLMFMFHFGGRNPSIVLVTLFAGWVASPFVGACVLILSSRRWSNTGGVVVAVAALVMAAAALMFYGGAIPLRGFPPAFRYLAVPFVSWVLLVGVGVGLALTNSRRE